MFRRIAVNFGFIAGVAGLLISGSAQALLIDDFADAQIVLIDSDEAAVGTFPPGVTESSTITPGGATNILGGTRMVSATLTNPGSCVTIDSTVVPCLLVAIDGSGVMKFEQSFPSTATGDSTTTWDADGLGLMGVDLTDGGDSTQLVVGLIASDLGGVLVFTLEDTFGQIATASIFLPLLVSSNPMQILGVSLGAFVLDNGAFDLTSVDKIEMFTGGIEALDFTIVFVATVVPEPATLAIFGFGLLALGFAVRRRQRLAA